MKYKFAVPALLPIFVLLSWTPPAPAQETTYRYTGNTFVDIDDDTPPIGEYTTAMKLTGSVTFSEPLGPDFFAPVVPIAFSFFEGRNTVDNNNAELSEFSFLTDESGQILSWLVDVTDFFETSEPGDYQQVQIVSTENEDYADLNDCVEELNDDCLVLGAFSGFDGASVVANPGSWSVAPSATDVHSELVDRLFGGAPPPGTGPFLTESQGTGLVIAAMEDQGYLFLAEWIPQWGGRCANFWPSRFFECREPELPMSVAVAALEALDEAENIDE